MPHARRSKVNEVALVFGGGEGLGRDVALVLAAQGVKVVVSGAEERAIGRVVGEVTAGGGGARHLAGRVEDAAHVTAAIAKAGEAFGGLGIVVIATEAAAVAAGVVEAVKGSFADGGRVIVVVDGSGTDRAESRDELSALVARSARALGERATFNAVVWKDRGHGDTERVGEVVLFLSAVRSEGVTGQTIEVVGRDASVG